MPNKQSFDIAIIGGGASGLAAAIAAARAGKERARAADIVILEKLDRVGKKLLATGNGRCNLANASISAENYSSASPDILAQMIARAPAEKTLDFFASIGLLCETETGGRVYPYCRQASMALDVLRRAAERLGVKTVCNFCVSSIKKADGVFEIAGGAGERVFAKLVVLAAGGCASPQLGSDGSGFALAKSLGHSVTPLYPCLVPLKCDMDDKSLKGIRAECAVRLVADGRELHSDFGEVQFTEYGLSGIPAMQLSRFYSQGACRRAEVHIDFFPHLSEPQTAELLSARLSGGEYLTADELLLGTLNKRISSLLLKRASIEPAREVKRISHAEAEALLKQMKDFRLRVTGALPWANAQVTRGGVPLGEIDPATCESRICPRLFCAGELLDAAGDCGGYNLHWAWSTGTLVGARVVASCARSE